jgi:hypothetical protein
MTNPEKSQFLLLFRHPLAGDDPTPEEMQQIFGKWMSWMKSMKAKGQFVGADRLEDAGKVLRPVRGSSATDGPYAEAKEAVGGFVIVLADTLAEATEIAKGCPGLERETIVEVRPIEKLPPI